MAADLCATLSFNYQAKCWPYAVLPSMEDLKEVFFSTLTDTTYVRPFRFNYTQNGQNKTWDLLEVHDSVAIIIFNVERKMLVFVKQFRPGEKYYIFRDFKYVHEIAQYVLTL